MYSRFCIYAAVMSLFIPGSPLPAADETLRIGMAETDITPPMNFPMAGYYHERLSTATHDPLLAKAIVFRSGDDQAALVVCDLIGIAVDLTTEARKRVSQKLGIPAEHVIVCATHSHTAPDYTKDLYDFLSDSKSGSEGTKSRYAEKLITGIVNAIEKASTQAQPATLHVGSVPQETPVAFNRRFVMKDGSVRTWMRLDQPDVLRAAGPIDPEVAVALFRAADDQQPLGVLSNFALHLDTVGGTAWSADYPMHIAESIRKALGSDVISIFGTGCCGDINHVSPTSTERNKTDFIGQSIGATVQSALPQLSAAKRQNLRVLHTTVRVPLQDVPPEQLARAQAILPAAKAGRKTEFFDLVTAYKSIMLEQLRRREPRAAPTEYITWGLSHTWAGVGDHLPVDVQAVTIGDELAIVCLPGEVFVELGLAIKRASPFRTTMVIELANAVETVYIPTRVAYAVGSYEVTNSTLQPGSGEMLAEAAVRLLREAASSK